MTINYVEKGSGLHEAVCKAGHVLREENGVMVSSDDTAVQAIIDAYTLADAQTHRCAEVADHAKLLRDKAIKAVSAGEMASWAIKLAEANAYPAACPMLEAEAAARGIALDVMVAKVRSNAAGFSSLEAAIAGRCGFHRDAIKRCASFEDVAAYDFGTGWPVI